MKSTRNSIVFSLMNRTTLIAITCLFLSACTSPTVSLPKPPSANVIKPTVAVTSFENRSNFDGQWNLPHGMADLLVAEMVASKHFVLVERQRLNHLIGEIDNQRSDYFRKQGKAEFGRLKNVEYFIRGVITDFTQVSRSSLGAGYKSYLGGYRGHTARVALTMTIVDVESGQIISSVNADGYAKAGGVFSAGEYKNVRFGGDAFFRTPLGIATRDAIRRGLKKIVAVVPKDRKTVRVAAQRDNDIIVTGGRALGHKVGMVFEVMGADQVILDPATGDAADVIPGKPVGRVRVTTVRERTSFVEVLEGKTFTVGQQLRPYTPPTPTASVPTN